ncbi:hypothetical protein BU17DRAFT_93724 [Hysterangium stoloniferum]|nr:hypothetical protein BU17DRAFT_93724 [Hysterangium stoloniferum]
MADILGPVGMVMPNTPEEDGTSGTQEVPRSDSQLQLRFENVIAMVAPTMLHIPTDNLEVYSPHPYGDLQTNRIIASRLWSVYSVHVQNSRVRGWFVGSLDKPVQVGWRLKMLLWEFGEAVGEAVLYDSSMEGQGSIASIEDTGPFKETQSPSLMMQGQGVGSKMTKNISGELRMCRSLACLSKSKRQKFNNAFSTFFRIEVLDARSYIVARTKYTNDALQEASAIHLISDERVGDPGLIAGLLDPGPLGRALSAVLQGRASGSLLDEWQTLGHKAFSEYTNSQSIKKVKAKERDRAMLHSMADSQPLPSISSIEPDPFADSDFSDFLFPPTTMSGTTPSGSGQHHPSSRAHPDTVPPPDETHNPPLVAPAVQPSLSYSELIGILRTMASQITALQL